jgi:glycosyltransferase involved in cell wall biosynthesis
MNKVLIVTSVASMVDQFLLPSMLLLQDMGYKVDVACNFEKGNTCNAERVEELKKKLDDCGISFYQIDFARNVFQLAQNKLAYGQLRSVITANDYKLIHCHSPIGGLLGRLAARRARKKGTRVFYSAHGFHFYKGAPLKNWLFYYPVEKVCSYFTDVLITINQEDYALAKKKMKAKKVEYVPGVGIDLSRFENIQIERGEKRREIRVPEDAFLLLSVGELNENKNHQIILKALAKINNPKIHYAIAGVGDKKEYLLELADELGVSGQLHLLGYRNDIPQLNAAADIFCFPSYREGLGLGAIEAMACGLPLITSNVHGINDYSIDGVTGYKSSPSDVDGFTDVITKLVSDCSLRMKMGQENIKLAKKYSVIHICSLMRNVYES